MPTLEAQLCWALPVKVEELGAHLEAYVKLLPVITTLRLCNRFGEADQGSITKLPAEMMDRIEGYLVEAERATQRELWSSLLTCWEGRCTPLDHIVPTKCAVLWEPMESSGYLSQLPRSVVTGTQDEEEDGDALWVIEHDARTDAWEDRLGHGPVPAKGCFLTYAALTLKHFGLEVWTSHVELQEPHNPPPWKSDEPMFSTAAYLVLPVSNNCFERYLRRPDSPESSDSPIPTESGHAYPVSFGRPPAEQSLKRFQRALRILGIRALSWEPKKRLYPSNDQVDVNNEEEGTEPNYARPQLMLLTKSRDVGYNA